MLKTINDLYEIAKKRDFKKKLVLAAAQDEHALDAAYQAWKRELIDVILVGNKRLINEIAKKHNYDLSKIEIIDESDVASAVRTAVVLVHNGHADILMKGAVDTASLLRAVLNKEWGLRTGSRLSHFSFFEIPKYHKLLGITDVAMNIAPDLKAKISIVKNAVSYMNEIGIKNPKVAPLCSVEVVNEVMPATIDAAVLSVMAKRGQIKNCIIDGPLAFDNALSKESAKLKGIVSDVAGDADLLLFPNIEAGNVVYKSLSMFGDAKLAAVILGASAPIVLTSRADSEETKLNSIILAAVGN